VSFSSFGLSPELLRAVADQGYETPTPVQEAAIPLVLEGRDVLAGAQTGTGKTAAFVLPIIHRLHETRRDGVGRHPVRCLVVVPTRELAIQVEESVRIYGAHRPVRSATVYGGVGFGPQLTKLRAGPEIVVATPGRLIDHIGQRTIDLSHVEVLVLDEADRMLDMGFIRDIRKILALLPPRRQNLLFSATFSDDIRDLASGLLTNPAYVQVTPRNTTTELIDQLVIPVDRERKRDLVRELVALGRVRQALVFTRTKHGANRLALQLAKDGIRAAAIHGNKSQSQRVKALDDFKAGRVDLLVATDIAARGLDIEQLPHVLNFELPMVPEDYVHRIGRTGRAGETGQAISLVCVDEAPILRSIQQLLKRVIPSEVIPGFEPDRSVRPEPIRLRSTPAERREHAAEKAGIRGVAGGAGAATFGAGSSRPRRPVGPASEETGAVHASGGPRRGAGGGRGRGRGRGGAPAAPGAGIGNGAAAFSEPGVAMGRRPAPGETSAPAMAWASNENGRRQGRGGEAAGATRTDGRGGGRPQASGQGRPQGIGNGPQRSGRPSGPGRGQGAGQGQAGIGQGRPQGIGQGRPGGQGRPQGPGRPGGPGRAPGHRGQGRPGAQGAPGGAASGHGGGHSSGGAPRALPGERIRHNG
jgi:ATP-dependent RNA helicase RhlE